jgi:hypothetical protein
MIKRKAGLVPELHPLLASLAQYFVGPDFLGAWVSLKVSLAVSLSLEPTRLVGYRLPHGSHLVVSFATFRRCPVLAGRVRNHPSQRWIRGSAITRSQGILLDSKRISATVATMDEPWTHHVGSTRIKGYPLITSGTESAMRLHFAAFGLAPEELEPLLVSLAMMMVL